MKGNKPSADFEQEKNTRRRKNRSKKSKKCNIHMMRLIVKERTNPINNVENNKFLYQKLGNIDTKPCAEFGTE